MLWSQITQMDATFSLVNYRKNSWNHLLMWRPAFPELKITNGPQKPIYPTTKKSLVPILKSDTSKNRENKKKTITSNWEISSREPKMPNNHNLNFTNFDDDLLRIRSGNSSPKFASHHALCTNPVRNSMFQFYIPIFQ